MAMWSLLKAEVALSLRKEAAAGPGTQTPIAK